MLAVLAHLLCMHARLQLTADRPSGEEKRRLVGRRGSLLTPAGHSDNCTRQVIVSAGRGQGLMAVRVLDELDLGKLMMLVHQARQTGHGELTLWSNTLYWYTT